MDEDAILKDVYYTKKNFFGRDKLYGLVKDRGITRRKVADWLKKQKAHQMSIRIPKNKIVKPIVSRAPFKHIQIDMIDMSKYATRNKGITFVLTAIDLYTKYAWAKVLTEKTMKNVSNALKEILDDMPIQPSVVQSDNEFKAEFSQLLRDRGIKEIHSLVYKPTTQGAIERFNQTIKRLLKQYMYAYETKEWYNALDDIVENYNNVVHESTGISPIDAKNGTELKRTSRVKPHTTIKKFKVGDRVRYKKIIPNEGTYKWSDTIHTIDRIIYARNPIKQRTYKLSELDGNYYIHDLQHVNNDIEDVPHLVRPPDKRLPLRLRRPLRIIDDDVEYHDDEPPPPAPRRRRRGELDALAYAYLLHDEEPIAARRVPR